MMMCTQLNNLYDKMMSRQLSRHQIIVHKTHCWLQILDNFKKKFVVFLICCISQQVCVRTTSTRRWLIFEEVDEILKNTAVCLLTISWNTWALYNSQELLCWMSRRQFFLKKLRFLLLFGFFFCSIALVSIHFGETNIHTCRHTDRHTHTYKHTYIWNTMCHI